MKNIPSIFCKKPVFIGLLLITANMAAQAQQTAVPTDNKPSAPATATPAAIPYPGIRNLNNTGKFNYIRTTVPDQPIQTLSGGIYSRVSTVFFDGLGRPLQTVAKKAHADGNDIVGVNVYDSLGREVYQYLPYAAPLSGYSFIGTPAGNIKLNDSTQMRGFYEEAGIDEQPYSQTVFESSPLNRVVKQMAPGKSWVGNSRGVTYDYKTNSPWSYNFGMWAKVLLNAYPKWTIGAAMGSIPQYAGSYDAGQLNIVTTTDEDGKQAWEVKDKAGLVLMKMQKAGTATSNLHPTDFAYTFYVYDQLNRLRCVMPPEVVKPQINADGWSISWNTLSSDQLAGLCYQYLYDQRSRLVEKKIPGKEVEYYIYDQRDRQVLYQDGNLRARYKTWMFTLYDGLDRPIAMGEYYPADGPYERVNLSALVNDNTVFTNVNSLFYYIKNYTLYHSYPPAGTQNHKVLSYTYYDDYTNLSNFSFDANMFTGLSIPTNGTVDPIPTAASTMTRGLPTGTKVRVMDPDDPNADNWLTSVNYYDDKGRVIQTKSQNLKGGVDVSSNLYFFQGMLYKNFLFHENPAAVAIPGTNTGVVTTFTLENSFNRNIGIDGGSDQVWAHKQKINNGIDYELAYYDYDHLGRSVIKQFTTGVNLQEYNTRGFLNHIAFRDYVTDGTGQQDILFDEKLYYDRGFASKLYNGNIAGITWWGKDRKERAYGYSYDNLNRLTHAEFNQKTTTGIWNKSDNFDYTVSNITYDLNGNILSMNQMAPNTVPNQAPIQMDAMAYHYAPNSNQLVNVYDAGVDNAALPDFKDGAGAYNNPAQAASLTEYAYDANGNMIADQNKGINTITYTALNKPDRIVVTGKGEIRYVYDAAGNRLQKRVYDYTISETIPSEIWDYIGNFVYKNNELQYILNEEGRARPVATPVPNSTDIEPKFVYDYFIKDHLGNVRSTVTAKPGAYEYAARHEIASANVEELFFDNIPNVRDLKPGSSNPGDAMAARLNADDASKIVGTALMLQTKPGDRFGVSVSAYYEGDYADEGSVDANDVVASLSAALMGGQTYGGIPMEELPENMKTIQTIFGNPDLAEQLNTLTTSNNNPDAPKAHLNYLWFDEHMQLDYDQSGIMQVSGSSNSSGWTTLQGGNVSSGTGGPVIVTPGSGFLLIYIDNQSIGKDVWFDNLLVTQYSSDVLEEDHYYPFGLTMNINAAQVQSQKNPYKYQGIPLEKHFGLETYETFYRGLDPQLGRFNSVDSKSEKHYEFTPYVSMGDNPVKNVDPMGDTWWETVAFAIANPLIAHDIGEMSSGSTNISTNAVRFSTRGASAEAQKPVLGTNDAHEGDQVNAFRHTLWQSTIANKYGTMIAEEVGRIHEENGAAIDGKSTFDLASTSFKTLAEADQSIDLANNIIGRQIAKDNPKLGMKDLALKTLDEFKNNGLWTARKATDGTFRMMKETISKEQYNMLRAIIMKLDNDGQTAKEKEDANKSAQAQLRR